MKVLVISGFLGAGKTTFLKALSSRSRRDFAIMENEYGPVGIDGSVLGQDESVGALNIFELTEGCICCSMKTDFATSVLTIANTIDPEFLIVEPTGVGMLSKVLENLKQIQYEKITFLAPITILDGRSFEHYLMEYSDILTDQLAAASTILISKMESASSEELNALEEKIRRIAPSADILKTHYSLQPDDWWQGLLQKGLTGSLPDAAQDDRDLENLGLTDVYLDSGDQLLLFLQGVVSGVFGEICRAKGYLKAGESWLRFDTVGNTYNITGCEPMQDSRAVFIGQKLHRTWLRECLLKELRIDFSAARKRIRYTPTVKGIPPV